jgi:hypothetical protein
VVLLLLLPVLLLLLLPLLVLQQGVLPGQREVQLLLLQLLLQVRLAQRYLLRQLQALVGGDAGQRPLQRLHAPRHGQADVIVIVDVIVVIVAAAAATAAAVSRTVTAAMTEP